MEEFKQYAKPAFDKSEGWRYENRERNIVIAAGGETAWFDEIMFNQVLGRCRGTGVLTRHDGDWKLATYSLTMLIPNAIAFGVGEQSQQLDAVSGQ